MKAMVLGARSFLGKHLLKHLSHAGYECSVAPSSSQMSATSSSWDRQLWLSSVLQLMQTVRPDVVLIAGASQRTDDGQEALDDLIASNVGLPASIAAELVKTSAKMLVVFGSSWQVADSNS